MPRRLPALLLAALALAAVPAAARAADTVPGEVVVGTVPTGAAAAAVADGAPPPTPKVIHVRNVRATIRTLRRRRGIAYAVPNVVAHASSFSLPDDRGNGQGWQALQWNFLGSNVFGVDAPAAWLHAWNAGRPGGQGVTIAVLDTGVAYANHGHFRRSPDFAGTHFVRGADFISRGRYPEDRNGHGTHVASTIAEATNNRIGVTGLAYGARIMPIRVLDATGAGNAPDIARGVIYAVKHHAKIINLSLEFSPDVTARDIPELISALAYAHRHRVFMVAAAGNEADPKIAYPARAPYVVSVGATTQHGCLSDFSNDGRGLDFVAPGGGADAPLSGDPNCHPDDPPGGDIYQMTFVGGTVRRFGLPSGYEGTSMAAPHVAATAALIIASRVLGRNPSPAAIEARLKQTAHDLGPRGYDTRYGWGLIDAGAATDPAIPAPGR